MGIANGGMGLHSFLCQRRAVKMVRRVACGGGGRVVCALVHIRGDSHELHPFSVKSATPISSMPSARDGERN
jgi:hypothetical protein